jgi:hypothetical protein
VQVLVPFKSNVSFAVSKESKEADDEAGGLRHNMCETRFDERNGLLQSHNRYMVIQGDAELSCIDSALYD